MNNEGLDVITVRGTAAVCARDEVVCPSGVVAAVVFQATVFAVASVVDVAFDPEVVVAVVVFVLEVVAVVVAFVLEVVGFGG